MTHCLACGGTDMIDVARATDTEYFTSPQSYAYFECAGCGVLSIDPVPKDKLSEIYPSSYYSYNVEEAASLSAALKNWLDKRFFSRLLTKVNAQSLSVLDVGGGSGVQLSSLKAIDDRIDRTVIVDLDEHARDTALAKGHEYYCAPFEHYSDEAKFDVILMLNLVEHVDNPGETLGRARELLAPGGILIIKTPNTDSWDARLFRSGAWGGYHCPRHWVLFNKENFLQLTRANDLDTVSFSYSQGAPFWATSALAKLYGWGWVSLSAERPVFEHPAFGPLVFLSACFDVPRSWLFKTSQMFVVLTGRES